MAEAIQERKRESRCAKNWGVAPDKGFKYDFQKYKQQKSAPPTVLASTFDPLQLPILVNPRGYKTLPKFRVTQNYKSRHTGWLDVV